MSLHNTKRSYIPALAVLLAVSIMAGQTDATLIGVAGPVSSAGTLPVIIAPPSDVLDDVVVNTGMQAFDEAQNVLTTVPHTHDYGVIPAETLVNSHMIFLNSEGETNLTHYDVVWTFDNLIIAVMSDSRGELEAASTFELGAPGTNYTVTFPGSGPAAPFGVRGLEGSDSYVVAGNQINVSMIVTEPGDWIRVITAPEPTTAMLLAAIGIGLVNWRKRRRPL